MVKVRTNVTIDLDVMNRIERGGFGVSQTVNSALREHFNVENADYENWKTDDLRRQGRKFDNEITLIRAELGVRKEKDDAEANKILEAERKRAEAKAKFDAVVPEKTLVQKIEEMVRK